MHSLHAISELTAYMPCPHYMQFWSLWYICHATITCISGLHMEYAMPSVNAISELKKHMPYPQLLLCIAFHYFVSVHIN